MVSCRVPFDTTCRLRLDGPRISVPGLWQPSRAMPGDELPRIHFETFEYLEAHIAQIKHPVA